MLALRVMTLSDDEKQAMRAVDERARRILERTEAFDLQTLRQLHGTLRNAERDQTPAMQHEGTP